MHMWVAIWYEGIKHKVYGILDTGYLALSEWVTKSNDGSKHKAWSILEY